MSLQKNSINCTYVDSIRHHSELFAHLQAPFFRVFYLYVFYWIHMIMNALVNLLFCHSLNCY